MEQCRVVARDRSQVHRGSAQEAGRGGSVCGTFGRLRLEKRHNYLRKVADLATTFFINNSVPNVRGIILAGSAEFKNDLAESDMFDPRLAAVLIKIVDISYGGENGFNQASS